MGQARAAGQEEEEESRNTRLLERKQGRGLPTPPASIATPAESCSDTHVAGSMSCVRGRRRRQHRGLRAKHQQHAPQQPDTGAPRTHVEVSLEEQEVRPLGGARHGDDALQDTVVRLSPNTRILAGYLSSHGWRAASISALRLFSCRRRAEVWASCAPSPTSPLSQTHVYEHLVDGSQEPVGLVRHERLKKGHCFVR